MAAIWDNGSVTVFLNGKQEATASGRAIYSSVTPFQINGWGSFASAGGSLAYIDDVHVHSPPLTPAQIKVMSTRRGIAYETARRRSRKSAAAAPAFKPAWASQRTQMIGGGNR